MPEAAAAQQTMPPSSVAAPPAVPGEGAAEDNSSLYVGDLDKDVQETHLFDVFSGVRTCLERRVRAQYRGLVAATAAASTLWELCASRCSASVLMSISFV